MLPSLTLLERLAQGRSDRTVVADRAALVRSVLANVQRILNTRAGSAGAQMDLGLPSPHELMQGFPATMHDAQNAIRTCILKYEPRLAAAVVSWVPQPDGAPDLRFAISATLADDARTPLSFTTAVNRDGRIRLQDS